MASTTDLNVMSEAFLMDLFRTCMKNSYILSLVCSHLKSEHLPDRESIMLFKVIKKYYKEHRKTPTFSAIREEISGHKHAIHLLDEIYDCSDGLETDECAKMLETYIKRATLQKALKQAGEFYNKAGYDDSHSAIAKYINWAQSFALADAEYTDIVSTFEERFEKNKARTSAKDNRRPITRFYIDELDIRNGGRNLRTQLTCFLAATGVGKTHAARWIGRNACMDGLNVLHIQLEGSRAEVEDAYSASLVKCSTFKYEHGYIEDEEMKAMMAEINRVSGRLFVKAYPKFNSHISTIKIQEAIIKFKELYNIKPDVVIIDSMDLLTDASGRQYGENGERYKRINVANDLKDMAADENVWMVVTYQSTVENREWINNEDNVLTEYNTAEAKGLARPMTHLITLNASDNERKENTMRINVAKSRFFPRGEAFRIATDYEHEVFYDRARTMNINKVN